MYSAPIFICAKSEDYKYARRVYAVLVAQGVPCFFSDKSLLELGESDYKHAIDAAIEAARHMVVVTSSRENAESGWVRYEWDLFAQELLSQRKKGHLFTVLCGAVLPGDLPVGLRYKQAFRFEDELDRLARCLGGARPLTDVANPNQPIGLVARFALWLLSTRWASGFRNQSKSRSEPREEMDQEFMEQASDYALIEPPFAEGAYGKVWLARNAIGQWQAFKTVYLEKFENNSDPYDREFEGIQRYKPVSTKHAGLLRVEFISRKQPQGFFYYVMELADSQIPGWEQRPTIYRPRDLTFHYRQAPGKRLPLLECAHIGNRVADALAFLHEQGLTHRDVKPSNILFVNGAPKLGDAGLVAPLKRPDAEQTWVGTPAYMPPAPEPPGTVQADVYSLGMVLYVISTGSAAQFFPELSITLTEQTQREQLLEWNSIVLKACYPDPAKRYTNARELSADLVRFLGRWQK